MAFLIPSPPSRRWHERLDFFHGRKNWQPKHCNFSQQFANRAPPSNLVFNSKVEGTIFTTPTSNFGSRVRHVLLALALEDKFIQKRPPGFKTPEFKVISPFGKIPALLLPDGLVIPESDVICRYLIERHWSQGGSDLWPSSAETAAVGNFLIRTHDIYMHPNQKALYGTMDEAERQKCFDGIRANLDIIEAYLDPDSPLVAGDSLTLPDISLYPTFVYYQYILPRCWGWAAEEVFEGRPKLQRWWRRVLEDPIAQRIKADIESGLERWASPPDGRIYKLMASLGRA